MSEKVVVLKVKVNHPNMSYLEKKSENFIEGIKHYINNSLGHKFKTKPTNTTDLINKNFLDETDTLRKDIYDYFNDKLGDIKIDYYTFEEDYSFKSVDVNITIKYVDKDVAEGLKNSDWRDFKDDKKFKNILEKYIENVDVENKTKDEFIIMDRR